MGALSSGVEPVESLVEGTVLIINIICFGGVDVYPEIDDLWKAYLGQKQPSSDLDIDKVPGHTLVEVPAIASKSECACIEDMDFAALRPAEPNAELDGIEHIVDKVSLRIFGCGRSGYFLGWTKALKMRNSDLCES
jgi:hypothetical protein